MVLKSTTAKIAHLKLQIILDNLAHIQGGGIFNMNHPPHF
jgi:hypothetical protein